ncbi:MAG: RNA-binding protein [Candidatus Aenigmatarchaeota archaeon]|nr:MAG: RNA-binding protein [Candidatus Aenigmarchaeota archaeon]
MMSVGNCISCGATITASEKFAKFPCPSCGGETILRCEKCKKTANKYICEKCGFVGP